MAILVTMEVGPVDWDRVKQTLSWGRGIPAPGRSFSRVYRSQEDASRMLIVEEWESHDAMHRYQDQHGEEFNRRAGTEGLEWTDTVWELTDSL